ncbi:MAG: penicillin acylase family protein [Bacteroidota bacterium]
MLIRSVLLTLVLLATSAASGQTAQDVTLTAPGGETVTIDRDDVGVPLIRSSTAAGVFFGQGFATAQDRLFQMETFWRTATGRLAELQGAAAVDQDTQIRTVFYTDAERSAQFAALSPRLQTMIGSYVDGVNAYIDSTVANPAAYLPLEYAAGSFAPEAWTAEKAMATIQFFIRRFGGIGGEELDRLAELQDEGQAWFDANRPINDPTASTTIEPTVTTTRTASGRAASGRYDGPPVDPALAEAVAAEREALAASLAAHGVPHRFGSFAGVISAEMSESGNVMLLGAPQMGLPREDAKAVTAEYELLVGEPGGGGLHVAGMSVPGIPGVIIGRSRGRAWTFTTGVSDNTDTFTLTLGPPAAGGVPTYVYNGETRTAEVFEETINVAGGAPVAYTHFRSVHGPVYALDEANGRAYAYRYTFWENELEMAEALYDAWFATSVEAFEAAMARVPVSFNIFYADQEQNIAFWHVGDYPVRPEGTDPRLPLMGDGTQEWTGTLDFADQPQAINPVQGFFANWNNKPAASWDHGDNVPWRAGSGRVYDGVDVLKTHLVDAAPISFEDLQRLNRVVVTNPDYVEYPGTYQQVVEFSAFGSYAENVIPPGQSGFVNTAQDTSAHFADQWDLYRSAYGTGDVEMKPFTFLGATAVAEEGGPEAVAASLGLPTPNPTTGAVAFAVALDAPAEVRLGVVDALGREVARLGEGAWPAGEQVVRLDATGLAPGVYAVRLVADGRATSRRFVVVR